MEVLVRTDTDRLLSSEHSDMCSIRVLLLILSPHHLPAFPPSDNLLYWESWVDSPTTEDLEIHAVGYMRYAECTSDKLLLALNPSTFSSLHKLIFLFYCEMSMPGSDDSKSIIISVEDSHALNSRCLPARKSIISFLQFIC